MAVDIRSHGRRFRGTIESCTSYDDRGVRGDMAPTPDQATLESSTGSGPGITTRGDQESIDHTNQGPLNGDLVERSSVVANRKIHAIGGTPTAFPTTQGHCSAISGSS